MQKYVLGMAGYMTTIMEMFLEKMRSVYKYLHTQVNG